MAKARKKAVVLRPECVACGSCIKACRFNAITIFHGIYAKIDEDLCMAWAYMLYVASRDFNI